MEERGNSLLVNQEKKETKKEILFKINEDNKKDLRTFLTHAYRRGFDKIILKGDYISSKEVSSTVHNYLLGFEITQQNKTCVIIENLSEPSAEKYDTMFKQIFRILKETSDIAFSDLKANTFTHLEDISDLKKQHDRYILFCRRVMMKNNLELTVVSNWEVLTALMQIEHQIYYLYEFCAENKMPKNSKIVGLFEKVIDCCSLFAEAYEKRDLGPISIINTMKEKIYFEESIDLLKQSKGADTVMVAYIREMYRKIQLGTSALITYILQEAQES